MNKNGFNYTVGSDVDYEDLIADIGFNNQLVAILSQESGFDNLEIKIFKPPNGENWEFNLVDFLSIIQKAKNRLYELRRTVN